MKDPKPEFDANGTSEHVPVFTIDQSDVDDATAHREIHDLNERNAWDEVKFNGVDIDESAGPHYSAGGGAGGPDSRLEKGKKGGAALEFGDPDDEDLDEQLDKEQKWDMLAETLLGILYRKTALDMHLGTGLMSGKPYIKFGAEGRGRRGQFSEEQLKTAALLAIGKFGMGMDPGKTLVVRVDGKVDPGLSARLDSIIQKQLYIPGGRFDDGRPMPTTDTNRARTVSPNSEWNPLAHIAKSVENFYHDIYKDAADIRHIKREVLKTTGEHWLRAARMKPVPAKT